jgi:hypothetical protein
LVRSSQRNAAAGPVIAIIGPAFFDGGVTWRAEEVPGKAKGVVSVITVNSAKSISHWLKESLSKPLLKSMGSRYRQPTIILSGTFPTRTSKSSALVFIAT